MNTNDTPETPEAGLVPTRARRRGRPKSGDARTCADCGVVLVLGENWHGPTTPYCKPHHNQRKAESARRNREATNARNAKWLKEHPEVNKRNVQKHRERKKAAELPAGDGGTKEGS